MYKKNEVLELYLLNFKVYLGAGTSDAMCPSTSYGATLVPVHIMHCCVLIFVLLFAFLKICFTLSYLAPIFASIHHWWGNIIFFFQVFLDIVESVNLLMSSKGTLRTHIL